MKVFFSTIIFFIAVLSLNAKDKIHWSEGKIILEDNSEVSGVVSYNYKHGVVLHKNEDGITKAFSAAQVSYFEYFDELMQVPRRYIALPFNTDKNYKNEVFFELIMDGEIAVFRKEKKNINLEFIRQHDNENFTRYHASFDYYFFKEGSFMLLKDFTKNLLPTIKSEFPSQIDAFIEENGLNVENGIHAILVIDYYNALQDATYNNVQVAQSFNLEENH